MFKEKKGRYYFNECKQLGLGFWECPTSMFLFMSLLTASSLVITYLIASRLGTPEVAIGSITAVTIVMMVVNFSIHHGISRAADSKKSLESTNKKLESTLSKLKIAEKTKDEFLYMIIHDLRSPLNGIRMLSEMLLSADSKQKKKVISESVRLIHHGSNHMLMLVNDLLDFSKLETGHLKVNKIKQKVDDLLVKIVSYFLPMAEYKDLKIETNIALNLPEVKFDEQAIEQVLHNLLSNSLKFTTKGKIIIDAFLHRRNAELRKEAKQNNSAWQTKDNRLNKIKDSVIIAVSDSGSGIAKSEQNKLFHKYIQAPQDKNIKRKGTGLGLVISKGIISAHGGVIGLESKEGKGSTFYFSLPLV